MSLIENLGEEWMRALVRPETDTAAGYAAIDAWLAGGGAAA